MIRCSNCCLPETRPDLAFVDGVCAACLNYAKRKTIDWSSRRRELVKLLESATPNGSGYDCIVPSSGGKDSTYQVMTLLDLGAKPLVVTATTCHLTRIGRANIDNLARYATTVELSPNKAVRAKLNRLGLQMVGDISWPEHVSIFTMPFHAACDFGIPLIFYGENPQTEYGGPLGTEDAMQMTRRWVSEFGGFLGLRPQDLIGVEGLTKRDIQDYMPPSVDRVANAGIQAHFLGQYIPWDSHHNAEVAQAAGMRWMLPTNANWWPTENQDNAQTGAHDFGMYLKYGYGRGCSQISVDVRAGRITRDAALEWVRVCDGIFPSTYMQIHIQEVLRNIGVTSDEFKTILDKFTNHDLFNGVENSRPILKEFAS